jgi:hypothetical protein
MACTYSELQLRLQNTAENCGVSKLAEIALGYNDTEDMCAITCLPALLFYFLQFIRGKIDILLFYVVPFLWLVAYQMFKQNSCHHI